MENIKIGTEDFIIIKIAKTTGDRQCELLDGVTTTTINWNIVAVRSDDIKKFEDVMEGNEVYIFGYPTSLSLGTQGQFELDKPLLRHGIIAGKNREKKTIILDCQSYGGNSGGPVLELEELAGDNAMVSVIGIVIQFIPCVEEFVSNRGYVHQQTQNSGYTVVVPMDLIAETMKSMMEI